jgi:hypothetical protein
LLSLKDFSSLRDLSSLRVVPAETTPKYEDEACVVILVEEEEVGIEEDCKDCVVEDKDNADDEDGNCGDGELCRGGTAIVGIDATDALKNVKRIIIIKKKKTFYSNTY